MWAYRRSSDDLLPGIVEHTQRMLADRLLSITYALAPQPNSTRACWALVPEHFEHSNGESEDWDHTSFATILFTPAFDALWAQSYAEYDRIALIFEAIKVVLAEWARILWRAVNLNQRICIARCSRYNRSTA